MVAWYPGGPRSSGPRGVCGAEDSEVKADTAEVGVKVESTGLAYACMYEGGIPKDEELKEEDDEPERPEAAMAGGEGFEQLCPK